MKTALLFPGQGSQSVGMLADVWSLYPVVKKRFEQGSAILGIDLEALMQDKVEINKTENTQPLLLTSSIALWDILSQHISVNVIALSGHSLGEYSALVVSGVLNFEDALRLVHHRGKLMQEASPKDKGAMVAILALSEEKIEEICRQISTSENPVSVANLNTPGQTVIAGERQAVEKVSLVCKESGVKRIIPLAVSVPSHCALMKGAADKLATMVDSMDFHSPKIPVYQNFSAQCTQSVSEIKENVLKQLYSPVRWYQGVHAMKQAGAEVFIECGPGSVLSGMMKKIATESQVFSSSSAEDLEKIFQVFS